LIENAIKYTNSGWVRVNIKLQTPNSKQIQNSKDENNKNSILIEVSDSGIGIKPETLPQLFDQFKRAKETKQIQGTGLGLYIAREIVKAHGGEIWAESEGEENGSTFYVRLKF
jgi:signal transduction histidine kinase